MPPHFDILVAYFLLTFGTLWHALGLHWCPGTALHTALRHTTGRKSRAFSSPHRRVLHGPLWGHWLFDYVVAALPVAPAHPPNPYVSDTVAPVACAAPALHTPVSLGSCPRATPTLSQRQFPDHSPRCVESTRRGVTTLRRTEMHFFHFTFYHLTQTNSITQVRLREGGPPRFAEKGCSASS